MQTQKETDFQRIAKAIEYLQTNFKNQPGLDEVAEKVNLSPFHFQRLFSEWAGVSPKKFLQYLTIQYAKQLLADSRASLSQTAHETGLSSTGRLHDLFVKIEGMTPGEYKNGGENLSIQYSFAESPFGRFLIASTGKGICHMSFADDEEEAVRALQTRFPRAHFLFQINPAHENILPIFTSDWRHLNQIKLHLKGTDFQLKVWETLLKIPMGQLKTYGGLANSIHMPTASRAVGTAIGDNPVAFLIPCHRVIQSSGAFGQYHWGSIRKTAMIGWEAALEENIRNEKS